MGEENNRKMTEKRIRIIERNEEGITLVALVVTIIILLILAGIVITLAIGQNGVMKRAEESGKAYNEAQAREKLELILMDLQANKIMDATYNENEYLNKKIQENGMTVIGDIVLVDGYQFQIDRSVPEIIASIGRGNENNEIQIGEAQIDYETFHYVKANLQVDITYEGEISEIIMNGKSIEPEIQDGTYLINEEVESNGKYTIVVKDKEGNYKISSIEVTEISEDMDIYTQEQLKRFRDRVNAGATFENRIVRVMNKIELNGSETDQWIPIGNEIGNKEANFQGTFDGNGKSIEGIYINNSLKGQGLFSTLGEGGCIKNITIKGNITSDDYSGGVVAYNFGTITNCHNYVQMRGRLTMAGIAGGNTGIIEECSNHVEVISNETARGICAINGGIIRKCYNVGNIVANIATSGGIAGINGYILDGNGFIYNCYNNATLSSNVYTEYVGGLTGAQGAGGSVSGYIYNSYTIQNETIHGVIQGGSEVQNCYTTNANTKLEELNKGIDEVNGKDTEQPWVEDTQNINNGYPILRWQLENNQ